MPLNAVVTRTVATHGTNKLRAWLHTHSAWLHTHSPPPALAAAASSYKAPSRPWDSRPWDSRHRRHTPSSLACPEPTAPPFTTTQGWGLWGGAVRGERRGEWRARSQPLPAPAEPPPYARRRRRRPSSNSSPKGPAKTKMPGTPVVGR
jgi:hypothetical protein